MDYLYEVREKDAIIATGHLSVDRELQQGDEIPFGDHQAIVIEVAYSLSGPARLLLNVRDGP